MRTWRCFVLSTVMITVIVVGTTRSFAEVQAVARVGMTVDDMDRSVAFYTDVLKFQKQSDVEVNGEAYERLFGVFGMRARVVELRLGEESIELTQYLTPQGRLIPRDSRSNDRWFQHIAIVVSDMPEAYRVLREHRVKFASTGPQRLPDWNKNAGGIQAFYFRDPDDHVLEVIYFPPGKGDARWHRRAGLFLGIDHTAVVVASTDASLKFYRDLLGMSLAGSGENYGDEQAHLNNVKDAHLRITTLRAGSGPGVEFLEYLRPGVGREYPADSQANDLWHWQTTVVTADAEAILAAVRKSNARLISDGLIEFPSHDGHSNGGKAFLVRDPDGHAVLVRQP
jgi:catechol 2,3-dioxygenase-like lactoylglutathione lyase family enzyme